MRKSLLVASAVSSLIWSSLVWVPAAEAVLIRVDLQTEFLTGELGVFDWTTPGEVFPLLGEISLESSQAPAPLTGTPDEWGVRIDSETEAVLVPLVASAQTLFFYRENVGPNSRIEYNAFWGSPSDTEYQFASELLESYPAGGCPDFCATGVFSANRDLEVQAQPVPEPGTGVLLGMGLLGITRSRSKLDR